MKKLNFALIALLFLGIITSCNKKDDVTDDEQEQETVVTPEQSKASIEQDGLALLSELQGIEQSQSVETGSSMVNFMNMASPFESNFGGAKILKIAEPVFDLANVEKSGIKPVYNSMKNVTEDPQSIQDVYDMAVGVYEWNSSTESWDYTDTGSSVLFKFPSSENGTTNDAYLEIKDYVAYTGPVPYIDAEEYSGDLPQSIKIEMGINGTPSLTYTFVVDYSSTGIPESLSTSLSFDGYTISFSMSNNATNTEAGFEHKFTHGDVTLMSASANVKGDWTENNVNNNTYTETYTEYEWDIDPETGDWYQTDVVLYTEEYDVIDGQNIFRDANAMFQVMNTKVEGQVDIKTLVDGLNDVFASEEDNANFDYDQATEDIAKLINDNALLKVKYADSDAVIAVMEAYTYDMTYTDMEWNDNTGDYEEIEVTEKTIGLRMKFTDGSLVDAETYFNDGFDNLIEQYENWFDDLGNTYGK